MAVSFSIERVDGGARVGVLRTPHGDVPTPVFMPVGTQGTVKALGPDDLRAIGADLVLSNTYHLMLRPGADIVREAGGLHRFMAWDGPILTDSGGFQVFSLARLRNITDEGVLFRSHIDGAERFLSPQDAIHIQEALGADIIMVLDHCPSYGDAPAHIHEATERTHRWAAICQQVHQRRDQALFGIVQGGFDAGGRRRSAEAIAALDFPGYAIGGLSVGESKTLELELLEAAVERLPSDRPRYVMGVGSPEDLVEHVARGIDMFDCVLPTRIARNGALFTPEGRANLRNARFRRQFGPVDETCDCYACRTFSAAYLHHLFRCEELLAYRLATIHNLRFLLRHMACMRDAIRNGTFAVFRRDFLSRYKPVDEDVAREQQRKWRLFNRSKPEPKAESGDLAAPEEEPA